MKTLVAVVVACAGLAMAAPAVGSEKFTIITPDDYEWSKFTRISISGWKKGKQGHVRMTVNRPRGWVSYQVRGTVKRDRIRAKFGRFGEIDLRYDEGGRWDEWFTHEFCEYFGSRAYGRLRGKVRYNGEGNLKPMNTKKFQRFAFRTGKTPRECTPLRPQVDPWDPGAIRVRASSDQRDVRLDAYQNGYFRGYGYLFADSRETRGKVGIRRVQAAGFNTRGDVDRKLLASDPDALSLLQTDPFRGSADFVRTSPDGGTWLGNLRVGLPGRPGVKLAGPDWTAQVSFPNR